MWRWQWRVTIKGAPAEHGTCPTKECALKCSRAAEERVRDGKTLQRMTFAELAGRYASSYLPTIPDSALIRPSQRM
ncbi:MAG: hypothetical protein ABI639_10765 [Thermoanaerobaculia bacterium]